jgi:hypothetical protein
MRPCEKCGRPFIVEPGFSLSGYGTTLCHSCGIAAAVEQLDLTEDELKELQEMIRVDNCRNRNFDLV